MDTIVQLFILDKKGYIVKQQQQKSTWMAFLLVFEKTVKCKPKICNVIVQ